MLNAVLDAEPARTLNKFSFRLELQSLAALPTVLATVSRLGCRIVRVRADRTKAVVSLLVPDHVAHRVQGCLGQLIEVLAVEKVSGGAEHER